MLNNNRSIIYQAIDFALNLEQQVYDSIVHIHNTCNDNGISVECFEKRYPSTGYDNAILLDNERFESAGNTRIYRGILLGFIVDIPKDFKPVADVE